APARHARTQGDFLPTIAESCGRRPILGALTGLRAIAALHVLVYHLAPRGTVWWLDAVFDSGYLGVGLFYVLSGFILTYNYVNTAGALEVSRRTFWTARFARIYPVYLMSLLVAAPVLVRFASGVIGRDGLLIGAAKTGVVAATNLTLTQGFLAWAVPPWNAPGWSLSAEMFFYALFPLLIGILGRLGTRALLLAAAVAYLVGLVPAVAFTLAFPHGAEATAPLNDLLLFLKFLPLTHVHEFVLGIVAGRWFLRGETPRWLTAAGVGAVLLIVAAMVANRVVPYALLHTGLLAPLFAVVICALATARLPGTRVLARPLAVRLGEASYALYLIHLPLGRYTIALLLALGLSWGWLPLIAFIVAAQAVSYGVFRLVEEPFRRRLRAALAPRAQRPAASVPSAA
ncbi:MAG TPA: acyltransferase, partial [Gemmatimonadaceae bacterium]|nr:acyltransferase [Gemmatimonadaceae bacterium]